MSSTTKRFGNRMYTAASAAKKSAQSVASTSAERLQNVAERWKAYLQHTKRAQMKLDAFKESNGVFLQKWGFLIVTWFMCGAMFAHLSSFQRNASIGLAIGLSLMALGFIFNKLRNPLNAELKKRIDYEGKKDKREYESLAPMRDLMGGASYDDY